MLTVVVSPSDPLSIDSALSALHMVSKTDTHSIPPSLWTDVSYLPKFAMCVSKSSNRHKVVGDQFSCS